MDKAKAKKLVEAYGNACLRAGQANSGACYDPSGRAKMEIAKELRDKMIDHLSTDRPESE